LSSKQEISMQLDPKWRIGIMAFIAAMMYLAALGPSAFPSFIPAGVEADIIKVAGLIGGLVATVGMSLGLISSSAPGPLAPQDPEVVKAATNLANAKTNSEASIAAAAVSAAMQNHIDIPPPPPGRALS
jgi:hypothetical protein